MGRPRKNPDEDILVATESGWITVNGQSEPVRRNVTRARRGSAIVKASPDMWRPIDVQYEVEQATAAPGERRGE